jgi:hypothetical protein
MSNLNFLHSGGNKVTLSAPANNPTSNVTFKLPQADGSSGQVLRTDGNGNLSWYTIPTATQPDYVKISEGEQASYGGAALIFDNLDVSTYKFFDVIAFLQPALDAQQLRFYYREGGASGSNITGNSYAYGFNEKKESNTSNCTAGSPDTYMRITGSIGNHASEGVGVNMRISVAQSGDIANTKWLANLVSWNAVYREQGNAARMTNGQGHLYDDTKYPTGFSLYFQSGNINNYSYTLYGMKR